MMWTICKAVVLMGIFGLPAAIQTAQADTLKVGFFDPMVKPFEIPGIDCPRPIPINGPFGPKGIPWTPPGWEPPSPCPLTWPPSGGGRGCPPIGWPPPTGCDVIGCKKF